MLIAGLFISGYPVWGWKRNSPWPWLGRWSFAKWLLAAIGVGILATLLEAFAWMVVRHYS